MPIVDQETIHYAVLIRLQITMSALQNLLHAAGEPLHRGRRGLREGDHSTAYWMGEELRVAARRKEG